MPLAWDSGIAKQNGITGGADARLEGLHRTHAFATRAAMFRMQFRPLFAACVALFACVPACAQESSFDAYLHRAPLRVSPPISG